MQETSSRAGSLRRGILGLTDAFAMSLALLALVMASSLATSAAAGKAGAAGPLSLLLPRGGAPSPAPGVHPPPPPEGGRRRPLTVTAPRPREDGRGTRRPGC